LSHDFSKYFLFFDLQRFPKCKYPAASELFIFYKYEHFIKYEHILR